jgi:hypothetical protein
MITLAEKTSENLFNKELSNLLEADNFDGFCHLINTKKEFNVSFDIPLSVTASTALKYVELMLYNQNQHYRINYINYLAKNRYTSNIIAFFNSLKDLELVDDSKIWENPIKELLEHIVTNKDLDLLHYLLECPVVMLGDFKSTNYIVSVFIKSNFKEGLSYFKYDPSFELYVVQEVVKQVKDEVEVDWFQFENLLNLSDLDLFKCLVLDHVNSEKAKNSFDWESLKDKTKGLRNKTMLAVLPEFPPIRLMTGETEGIEPIRDLLGYSAGLGLKSKYYSYQRAGYEAAGTEVQSLWLRYKLEVNLSTKSDDKKGIKI